VSNRSLFRGAPVAIVIVSISALLACASTRTNGSSTAPSVYASDTSSIGNGDGRTIENLLTARYPGVTVTPAPGGGLMIRIRGGNNSFYGGEQPLYVLDDIPLPPGSGGIVFVNPYDIKKIEVLKNPADVAVYGMRGGNGVIKITTNRH
jgi:TonB-dependent SusC/RagA subfamily outer membrane receptor